MRILAPVLDPLDAARLSDVSGLVDNGQIMGYVSHGTDANMARPDIDGAVMWEGTVQPNNMLAGDLWASDGATDFVTHDELVNSGPSGRLLTEATSIVYQGGLTDTTDLDGLAITFTVGARPVEVVAHLPWVSSTAATTSVFVQITDAVGTQIRIAGTSSGAPNTPQNITVKERINTPGEYTRKVQMTKFGGTGSVSNNFNPSNAAVVSSISAYEQ